MATTAAALPTSLFVSHGAPTLAVTDCPAHRFLKEAAEGWPRPAAIIVASAHWETDRPMVTAAARPETIHDFYGFPGALYELTYPAPGDPALAERTVEVLRAAGFDAASDPGRGLDHGAWVPLMLMYPQADIPVLQVSLQPHEGAAHHVALGRALAPLAEEGAMVLGSGGATHNLSVFRGQGLDAPVPEWVSVFADWVAEKIDAGDWAALENYRRAGPQAVENHPSEEHYLPLLVALGTGLGRTEGGSGEKASARLLHRSYTHAVLAMDAYAFA